jgi:hypothetical protein
MRLALDPARPSGRMGSRERLRSRFAQRSHCCSPHRSSRSLPTTRAAPRLTHTHAQPQPRRARGGQQRQGQFRSHGSARSATLPRTHHSESCSRPRSEPKGMHAFRHYPAGSHLPRTYCRPRRAATTRCTRTISGRVAVPAAGVRLQRARQKLRGCDPAPRPDGSP